MHSNNLIVVSHCFGLATPRLSRAVLGSPADQGIYQYTYGRLTEYDADNSKVQQGVDQRTDTFTDALGSVFSTTYEFTGGYTGATVAQTTTGPAFHGASLPPTTRTTFTPNSLRPTSLGVYDAAYVAPGGRPWGATFDNWGNLTFFTDPLAATWSFGYSADGKRLEWAQDPTSARVTFRYGEAGQHPTLLTSVLDPAGAEVAFTICGRETPAMPR